MEGCRFEDVQSPSEFCSYREPARLQSQLFCSGDLQHQGDDGNNQNAIQFAITASSMMQQNETVFSHCIAAAAGTSTESGTEVDQLIMKNADCEMNMTAKPDGFAVMVE